MARIRNSSLDNWYGEGKQQIFTDDSGKEYIIKNSSLDNVYGTGKEKVVVESGESGGIETIIPWWLTIIIIIICIVIQRMLA